MPPVKMQKAMRNSRGKRQQKISNARSMKPKTFGASPAIRSGRLVRKGLMKRGSGSYTKSSGFVKTYKKTRKYTRRTGMIYNGVTRIIETSSVATDPEIVYLGHSVPLYQVKYMAYWALCKELYAKAGAFVQRFSDSTILTACGSNVGDVIRIVYKPTADGAIANLDVTGLNRQRMQDLLLTLML